MRRAARDFLASGTLVDELRLEEEQPMVSFELRRQKVRKAPATPCEYAMPAVFGSVWKDFSNRQTAILAVNVSSERRTVRFRVPDGVKALSPLPGVPCEELSIAGDIASVAIAPRQFVAFAGSLGIVP